jgi:DNA repair exonuclease SbcCD ATPase subunit
MFKIKDLTVKNFMSVGNATQAVNFDRNDLTLVLGENLDLGGDDSGARNGTGKTTIINALSFALYGNALTNIKKDNLINKTNTKGMLVTIDFEKDGINYRIERGRKPNIMKFWVNDTEREITDDSQGDSRETQAEIERMLGMSHDMFKHILALNTYTEPFLSLKANDQRTIIEQLLGITLLSEKAEKLKELSKATKDAITQEEFRIKAVGDANKRIEEQIENLKRRQTLWQNKHNDDLDKLLAAYDQLSEIDIEAELLAHKALTEYNEKSKKINELNSWIKRCELDEARENKAIEKLKADIESLENHTCHSCGQAFHDDKQEQLLEDKRKALQEAALQALATNGQWMDHTDALKALGELGARPHVFYDQESDAFEHRSSMAGILQQLTNKQNETDPYAEQIVEMQTQGVEEINFDIMNQLTNVKEHQEFLLKLLTNKDSFIRKRIIDQNLSYLNARLGQYLDRIGLPHTVKFNNDLTVSITELGRDLDFDNLSRGERNRLILSLSWAFRDVWESLYQPINLLFIDELVDSGMDTSGVENALSILKKMSREANKSIWLVSHKDELAGRVNNTLHVVKENGFTSYNTDIEIVQH